MTAHRDPPVDLRQALSVTPFLHLIPKQDLAPLLSSTNIAPVDELEETIGLSSNSLAFRTRAAINSDPERFKSVLDLLVEDFSDFHDPELDGIRFKRPLIAAGRSKNAELEPDLPPLETKLYKYMKNIEDSDLNEFSLHLNLPDLDEREIRLGASEGEDFQDGLLGLFGRDQDLKKRSFDDDSSLSLQKRRKSAAPEGLSAQAFQQLASLVKILGPLEDENYDGRYWAKKNDYTFLNNHTLILILDHLLQLHNTPKYKEIDVENIICIQKLCLRSLERNSEIDWSDIPINSSEVLAIDHSSYFEDSRNLLLASRIMLVTIGGRMEDKRLYVDSYLRSVVDFVYSVLKNGILGGLHFDYSGLKPFKSSFSSLTYEIGYLLSFLEEYFLANEVDEMVITKLEYLTIEVLFTGMSQPKNGPINVSTLEGLKLNASKLLVTIFQRKEDQRQFILSELMSNLEKLPLQKAAAKHFKISNGTSVQLIMVLLVRLLQSFDISPFAAKISSLLNEGITKRLHYLDACQEVTMFTQEITNYANEIANILITKVNNAETAFKTTFTLCLEDLLSMLTLPEWPAAGILLTSLLRAFLFAVNSGNSSNFLESYLMEMAGKIGVKILALQKSTNSMLSITSDSTKSDLLEVQRLMNETLGYLNFQSTKSNDFLQSSKILACRYVELFKDRMDLSSSKRRIHLAFLQSGKDEKQTDREVNDFIFEASVHLFQAIKDGGMKSNHFQTSDQDLRSRNCYTSLVIIQDLNSVYDSFLDTLIKSMNSNKIKTKTRAVRVLSSLVGENTEILSMPKVQESVSRVLVDSSPLARDAAIDLIGKYMMGKPQLIEQFHRPICDRMSDESIQVRKRAVKLTRDMYVSSTKRNVKVYITSCMLKRLDDEESSLAELAKAYLAELWFTSLYSEIGKEQKSVSEGAMQRAEVMMDVVSSGGLNTKYLQMFLSEHILLHRNAEIETSIKLITDKTLDFIIDCVDTKFSKDVEKALILISSFVDAEPKLMNQDQLLALQPFLVDEQNSGEAVCFYSLKILRSVLPGYKALRPNLVDAIQTSLLKRLTKLDVKELHQAMPSLWILCGMRNNTAKLANATVSCMRMIKPYVDKSQGFGEEGGEMKLIRLLHLLGCFGSYCNFEPYRDVFLRSKTGLKDKETVASLITKFLLFFSDGAILIKVRSTSVRNIMNICTYNPKLFLSDSILKVLDREFDGDSMETKHVIIQGIIGFLNKEDSDVQKRNGAHEKSSQDIKLDVAAFHGNAQSYVNDGVCAGVIQRYLSKILELCLCDSGDQSLLPIQFLQIVVKLGFANPKICITTIFALEASSNRRVKLMAAALHKELFEKHESLTDASYLEGLKLAVDYRKRVSKDFCRDRGFLASVYGIVNASYSAKKKFIYSICRAFSIKLKLPSLEAFVKQRDVVVFTAVNISSVMFSSFEEVLIVVHYLDKTLTREGIDLSDLIAKEHGKKMTVETRRNLQYLFIASQTVLAMVVLRSCLVNAFNLTRAQIEEFRPNKANLENRQAPKVVGLYQFPLQELELGSNLAKQEGYGMVFARLLQRIREFTTSTI